MQQLKKICFCRHQYTALLGLLVAVMISQPVDANILNVPDYNAKVTASALNVRSGPSTAYPVIGTRYYDQTVRVTLHDGDWRFIVWPGRRAAYVHGAYLRTGTAAAPPPVIGDRNISDYDASVTASALNVRSGPSTNFGVIGTRYKNQTVRVTHNNGVWRRIVWSRGRSAYVHGNYLIKRTTDSTSNDSPSPSPAGGSDVNVVDYTAFVESNSLSVRAGAGTQHTRTDSLTQNESLRVTHHSADGEWAKVFFYGDRSSGYVRRDEIVRGTEVDLTELQELEQQNPGAAEQYLDCMIGKFTSKPGAAWKAWTLLRNGVTQGVKKLATSPMIAVNHIYCLVSAHEWADPPKPFSPQAETCTPAMGSMTGCKELNDFYGTPEGIKIWDAFQFTAACDAECKLTCYFHGKNKRTYQAFIDDPQTVARMCRYQ